MEEKSFFNQGDVSVSNSRFIVSGQTYAMNGVTSVKTGKKYPSRNGPFTLGFLGIVSMFIGTAGTIITGLVMIGLAVYWWRNQKTKLSVVLSSSSGEAQALSSNDPTYINDVVEALNNAIIHRG